MKRRTFLVWCAAPLGFFLLGSASGHWFANRQSDASFRAPSSLTADEISAFEGATAMAIANVTWVAGSVDQVKETSSAALQALPESAGRQRARLFLRIGLVDDNPDGQRALSASACAADADVCHDQAATALREAERRLVAPGNRLPLWLLGGHPPIPAP